MTDRSQSDTSGEVLRPSNPSIDVNATATKNTTKRAASVSIAEVSETPTKKKKVGTTFPSDVCLFRTKASVIRHIALPEGSSRSGEAPLIPKTA